VAKVGTRTAREAGFTVIELAVVAALATVLLSIGAVAVRHFWLVRSIKGAQDQVVAQLRQVQQRSAAETYPIIYGVRFLKGSSSWGVVRYNASTTTCAAVTSLTLPDGIQIVNDAETDFPDVATATTACRNAAPSSASYEVVFFYPKGSTNASSTVGSVKLIQPALNRTAKITVSNLTGRVTRT
jgi:Tfp pilus assembly protein FimT